ncbi:NAD(P)-binding protein [Polyplosphaeria fusca]|uniref:NAD(P)-binding protein n=1 Tax=Polyplosphaeria fusca TaxID=682080 RepID=A0A9P4QRN0_9PLEO|nr:NAD(P)-binding protein [Polyplosphaeria fusca]
MTQNKIEKIAIIGATGNIGKAIAEALVATGKHTVTAITRPTSTGTLPEGVKIAKADYASDPDTLVPILTGQDFLIITLSAFAPPETQPKIVAAAVKAGVKYVMPNVYGADIFNETLAATETYTANAIAACKDIEAQGATHITVCCSFWYEWSLGLFEQWYGFNIRDKTVTLFDDGTTKINTSTWDQCGRAVAALLSLPVSGASPCLEDWDNKPLYISSFLVSQRDMLDSLHRVMGTKDADWKIKYEGSRKRYDDGRKEMAEGVRTGFVKSMYSRIFFQSGEGDYETTKGLANGVLGLPKEDLDEATKRTVDIVEGGWNPFAGMNFV